MNKKIILAIILISVFFISGCIMPVRNRFHFQAEPCNESIDHTNKSLLGIQKYLVMSTEYEGKVSYKVESYVAMNCGENITGGSLERIFDDMFLRYSQTDCNEDDSCQLCTCVRKLTHTIAYVPDRDYNLTLERK